ncbi:hypothetical protein PoB_003865200 [Plakobranchus ocellatus]|uniref:Uncharacterized protein n=1 Tax=Plakobranchus ocellatus TaxID=259542 RepID=A0AAV4AYM4_9GAST|nr:hypothetical protein PoB_003865200 [Plakobranchus ocellatus]
MLLLSDRARHSWSATTVCNLFGEREESIPHVFSEYWALANVCPIGWAAMSLNDILTLSARQDCHECDRKHNAGVLLSSHALDGRTGSDVYLR